MQHQQLKNKMRLFEFKLFEYDVEKTIESYKDQLVDHYQKDRDSQFQNNDPELAAKIVSYLESVDPTKKKAFTLALVRWYAEDSMHYLQDAKLAIKPIELYMKFKNRLSGINLNTISFSDFLNLKDELKDQKSGSEQKKASEQELFDSNQAELYYDDSNVKIVIPKTEEAAIYFSKHTKWCTSGNEKNQFDRYNSYGPLYIVLFKKENKRWQLQFETSEFMDDQNHYLTGSELLPVLEKYFKPIMVKMGKNANILAIRSSLSKLILEYNNNPNDKVYKSIQQIINNMPEESIIDFIKDDIGSTHPKNSLYKWVVSIIVESSSDNEILNLYKRLLNSFKTEKEVRQIYDEFNDEIMSRKNPYPLRLDLGELTKSYLQKFSK